MPAQPFDANPGSTQAPLHTPGGSVGIDGATMQTLDRLLGEGGISLHGWAVYVLTHRHYLPPDFLAAALATTEEHIQALLTRTELAVEKATGS